MIAIIKGLFVTAVIQLAIQSAVAVDVRCQNVVRIHCVGDIVTAWLFNSDLKRCLQTEIRSCNMAQFYETEQLCKDSCISGNGGSPPANPVTPAQVTNQATTAPPVKATPAPPVKVTPAPPVKVAPATPARPVKVTQAPSVKQTQAHPTTTTTTAKPKPAHAVPTQKSPAQKSPAQKSPPSMKPSPPNNDWMKPGWPHHSWMNPRWTNPDLINPSWIKSDLANRHWLRPYRMFPDEEKEKFRKAFWAQSQLFNPSFDDSDWPIDDWLGQDSTFSQWDDPLDSYSQDSSSLWDAIQPHVECPNPYSSSRYVFVNNFLVEYNC